MLGVQSDVDAEGPRERLGRRLVRAERSQATVGNLIISGHFDWDKRLAVFARLAIFETRMGGDRRWRGLAIGIPGGVDRLYDVASAPLRDTDRAHLGALGDVDHMREDVRSTYTRLLHRAVVRARLVGQPSIITMGPIRAGSGQADTGSKSRKGTQ